MHIRSTSTCAGRKWLCLIHTFCKLRCKLWLRSVNTHCQFLGRFEFLVRDYVDQLANGKKKSSAQCMYSTLCIYNFTCMWSVLLLQLIMKSMKTELHRIIQDLVPRCEPLASRRICMYLPHLPGQGGCSWYRGAYFVKLFVYDLFIILWSWNRWNCADNSLHTVLCRRRGVFGRSTAPRGCRDMVSCYSIYIYIHVTYAYDIHIPYFVCFL